MPRRSACLPTAIRSLALLPQKGVGQTGPTPCLAFISPRRPLLRESELSFGSAAGAIVDPPPFVPGMSSLASLARELSLGAAAGVVVDPPCLAAGMASFAPDERPTVLFLRRRSGLSRGHSSRCHKDHRSQNRERFHGYAPLLITALDPQWMRVGSPSRRLSINLFMMKPAKTVATTKAAKATIIQAMQLSSSPHGALCQ